MKTLFSALVLWIVLLTPTAWCDPISVTRTLTEDNFPSEGMTCVVDMLLRTDGMIQLGWAAENRRPPNPSRTVFVLDGTQIPELESLLKKSVEWLKIAREKDVLSFDKTLGVFNNQPLKFYYDNKDKAAYLGLSGIDVELVPAVLKILEQYPEAKKELDKKLAQSAKESELFK